LTNVNTENIPQSSDVGDSVELQLAIPVSSPPISDTEVNLLNNPMREEIAKWLEKHEVHLSKIVIPGNKVSEYDKIVEDILVDLKSIDDSVYNLDKAILYKEEIFNELAKMGIERKLETSSQFIYKYNINELLSAISEPNLSLPIKVSSIDTKSANPVFTFITTFRSSSFYLSTYTYSRKRSSARTWCIKHYNGCI
jgi:hypothetical protein